MMTPKDFQRIAQVFRVNRPTQYQRDKYPERYTQWCYMLTDMCIELKAINPRFDEDKFRKACTT